MNLNFIVALFWLVLASVLFIYPQPSPQAGRTDVGDSGVSLAWVAVFFCAYNMLRWWLSRLQKRKRDSADGR